MRVISKAFCSAVEVPEKSYAGAVYRQQNVGLQTDANDISVYNRFQQRHFARYTLRAHDVRDELLTVVRLT